MFPESPVNINLVLEMNGDIRIGGSKVVCEILYNSLDHRLGGIIRRITKRVRYALFTAGSFRR
jgi:hypothetical protein